MSREGRQAFIIKMMNLGSKFEDIYKESDGIPRFSWWIHTSVGTSYMIKDKTEQEAKEHAKAVVAKYKREDRLGYTIEID